MLASLLRRLWNDECGAVVATEYLMLGSIVAAGSASGMAAMRDSMVDEYKDFGNSVRELRQTYKQPGSQGAISATGGTAVVNPQAPFSPVQSMPVQQQMPVIQNWNGQYPSL